MKQIKTGLERYSHWVLLSPFLVCFTIFILLPVLCAIGLSFTQFDTVQLPRFVGLGNYISIFTQDREFMQYVLPNTIVYALAVGPGGYLLSFLLAWLLSQLSKWPRTILAIIIYSPSILGNVALAVVWGVLFSGDRNGYLNSLLLSMGVIEEPILWLTSPQYLMPIMIFVGLWSSMGVGFLAMLSGILNVNPELYEAAAIDGAKGWTLFRKITWPLLSPSTFFVAMMLVINSFKVFDLVWLMTQGGPGTSSTMLSQYIYNQAFISWDYGRSSAAAIILFIIVGLLTVFQFKAEKKFVNY